MEIDCLSLPTANRLIADYIQASPEAMRFFSYAPYDAEAARQRLTWLKERRFAHRQQLADGLSAYNQSIGNDSAALANIESLRNENTYVVIAGQQAGVLTGPLYTIHKALSIIHTAKRLEAELGEKVVPVFWIAGEDHDIEEINHVYVPHVSGTPGKLKLSLGVKGKRSASMVALKAEAADRFVKEFFAAHPETEHTQQLRELVESTLSQAETVVEWFARLMTHLFGKHGLILVESSSPFVRELEKPVFRAMIERNDEVQKLLLSTESQLREVGYAAQLELDEQSAHLFIYEHDERLLLTRDRDGFRTKDGRHFYTEQQLLELLETSPERFSANVVSRPLAQEHIFPTLAFLGGPGEIGYWAYYKSLFAELGMDLPLIVPRTSITLLEGCIERIMGQLEISTETALRDFATWKAEWWAGYQEPELVNQFEVARQAILAAYQPLTEQVVAFDPGLRELAKKNTERLLEQIAFLEDRVGRSIESRHEVAIHRVTRLENALVPLGKPQERIWSVFTYLNSHGPDLIDRLLQAEFPFDGTHKIAAI
ncbi:bacillithiol biosynthesis cysteine-adding enzyme BshC [Brevibacillus fluminis]|uniref:Putative cysteine ligase BshC n=1 Tax=Brevibacillus fluminis TaxID=511487 RepID=A0A3M8DVW3_9BACL|nr:bacillithiol biosynthesis cysteine-adding enzyme BshC [Brevibacillus fluminis]RNB91127.1 bacillithiol biosynthesis cysteine-adding enzyme BshC [Brevibacillus fluminis]